jgi:hypothetical protein
MIRCTYKVHVCEVWFALQYFQMLSSLRTNPECCNGGSRSRTTIFLEWNLRANSVKKRCFWEGMPLSLNHYTKPILQNSEQFDFNKILTHVLMLMRRLLMLHCTHEPLLCLSVPNFVNNTQRIWLGHGTYEISFGKALALHFAQSAFMSFVWPQNKQPVDVCNINALCFPCTMNIILNITLHEQLQRVKSATFNADPKYQI